MLTRTPAIFRSDFSLFPSPPVQLRFRKNNVKTHLCELRKAECALLSVCFPFSAAVSKQNRRKCFQVFSLSKRLILSMKVENLDLHRTKTTGASSIDLTKTSLILFAGDKPYKKLLSLQYSNNVRINS